MKPLLSALNNLLVLFFSFTLVVLAMSCKRIEKEANFVRLKPGGSLQDIVGKAARVTPSSRQIVWQEMELTAFLHFGMNTFTDREWGTGKEDPALFNPSELDARQWVKACKDAGIKLIIITAKHHDGFCLWPTKYTEHSVKNSPWRNGQGDVIQELAEACRQGGLRLGVYLSPWDRHEPTYGDSPAYNSHFKNQLRELLTQYGPISEVWFDGACGEGPNGKRQVYDWEGYYSVVRRLQPEAVIAIMGPDVRWVGTETGYGRETEWSVIPVGPEEFGKLHPFIPKGNRTEPDLGSREKLKGAQAMVWYPSEVDVSIRPGWFYHSSQDDQVKTPEKLVDIYYSSVGRNSLLLLNIPPDRRGLIHENDVKSLRGVRAILDETFGDNLARGALPTASSSRKGYEPASVLDGNRNSYWTPEEGLESVFMEFTLEGGRTFDVALLEEYIRAGQRVEEFTLEAWDGLAWTQFAQGTTIGYRRLLRFPAVFAAKIRLNIIRSRTSPTLSTFGLFKRKDKYTF